MDGTEREGRHARPSVTTFQVERCCWTPCFFEQVLDRPLRDAVAPCQFAGTGAGAVAAEDALYLFIAEGVGLWLANRRMIHGRFLRGALLTAAQPIQDVGDGVRQSVLTEASGQVEIDVPRDRAGTFTSQIVSERRRRLSGVDEVVLSL
jgi:Transposase, Mutator family